jgi:hypothetical protein
MLCVTYKPALKREKSPRERGIDRYVSSLGTGWEGGGGGGVEPVIVTAKSVLDFSIYSCCLYQRIRTVTHIKELQDTTVHVQQ